MKLNIDSSRLLIRMLRIVSGLFLLAFVTTHLLNASLGMISVAAMDAARPYLTGLWSSTVLSLFLMMSLGCHFALGLWAIFLRPTLKTNTQDIVQILTSLFIVPLMATHVVSMVLLSQAGVKLSYAMIIKGMWIDLPGVGLLQVVLVTVVWVHGCAGLLTWLRSKEGARNVVLWVYPLAVAIPIAALLGFSEAGRRVLAENAPAQTPSAYGSDAYGTSDKPKTDAYRDRDYGASSSSSEYGVASETPAYGAANSSADYGASGSKQADTYRDRDNVASSTSQGYGNAYEPSGYGSSAASNGYGSSYETSSNDTKTEDQQSPQIDFAFINWITSMFIWGSLGLGALTFLARAIRLRLGPVEALYVIREDQPMPKSRSGLSVLDVFQESNQPHARLCEGRGRCGTCAVNILSSEFPVPEPSQLELRTIANKGLPDGARLACQLVPDGGRVEVQAIYPADYTFHDEEVPEDLPIDVSVEVKS